MNFAKHRVTEREMLSELLTYCSKILTHKRKVDNRFLKLSCCISTRTNGVEITYRNDNHEEEIILSVRYDERNDFYYFLEYIQVGNTRLENRIIIKDKDDFYAYFNHIISQKINTPITNA